MGCKVGCSNAPELTGRHPYDGISTPNDVLGGPCGPRGRVAVPPLAPATVAVRPFPLAHQHCGIRRWVAFGLALLHRFAERQADILGKNERETETPEKHAIKRQQLPKLTSTCSQTNFFDCSTTAQRAFDIRRATPSGHNRRAQTDRLSWLVRSVRYLRQETERDRAPQSQSFQLRVRTKHICNHFETAIRLALPNHKVFAMLPACPPSLRIR